MSQLRLVQVFPFFLFLALVTPLWGCGDDDAEPDGGTMDAGGDGDGDGTVRPRFDGGMSMPGEGEEGAPCETVNDCGEDLACVRNIFTIGVCARPCAANADCNADEFERCVTYQGQEDLHCVNEVEEAYGVCGVADTSICAGNRECLYFPDLPLGVCVDLCALESASGDGGADDGGASEELPDFVVECASRESCLDILAPDPTTGEASLGVCGTEVDRGDECGLDVGLYCQEGDICRRQDPENFDEAPRCRENCTQSLRCDEGTCTRLDLDTRVCI